MENKGIVKTNGQGVSLMASPAKLLQDGKRAAEALVKVVKQNGWAVRIQNNDYLQFEAWQTVAKFYGCSVKTVETAHVEYGGVEGFESKSVVIDRDGKEIGGAEGLCMADETNWKNKPLYALKSMAQTRSGAKALRQVFSWVVVLAGYKATPVEEMDGIVIKPATANGPTETFSKPQGELVTGPQLKLLNDMVVQGRLENKDYTKVSKKEASSLIDQAFKTKPGTIKNEN